MLTSKVDWEDAGSESGSRDQGGEQAGLGKQGSAWGAKVRSNGVDDPVSLAPLPLALWPRERAYS